MNSWLYKITQVWWEIIWINNSLSELVGWVLKKNPNAMERDTATLVGEADEMPTRGGGGGGGGGRVGGGGGEKTVSSSSFVREDHGFESSTFLNSYGDFRCIDLRMTNYPSDFAFFGIIVLFVLCLSTPKPFPFTPFFFESGVDNGLQIGSHS